MLIPVRDILSSHNIPADFLSIEEVEEVLNALLISDFGISISAEGLNIALTIDLQRSVVLEMPGVNGLALVFGRPGVSSQINLYFKTSNRGLFVQLHSLEFSLQFPPEFLRPYPESETEPFSAITVSGDISLDEYFNLNIGGFDSLSLSPAMIGNSGIVVSADGIKFDFSGTEAIPEVIAAGLDETFIGVYLGNATVNYHKEGDRINYRFVVRNAAIGSGGFTGEVALGILEFENENPDASLETVLNSLFDTEGEAIEIEEPEEPATITLYPINLLGMKMVLQYFGVSFMQSIPVSSQILGYVFLPFADKWVSLHASIGGPNGDFMLEVGGVGDEGLISLETEFFRITADSIAYLLRDGINYVIISGSIQLLQPPLDWPEFQVDRISIGSDGSVDIEGGWVEMPEALTLDLQGFRVSISAFGMGNEGEAPNERQWVGFSGEVQLMEGLPIRGAVEGLKISWPKEGPGDVQVSLEGIEVDLTIPGTLSFSGSVSLDRETNLFRGHIQLNLISLRMEMEASLMVGKVRNAEGMEFSVFYIYLGISLPSAIPLGATGTGLYGLAGLFGYNVAPTKTGAQTWYEWYKAAPEYDVTSLDKWIPLYDNLAFGVGVTLGTIYDDGTTINLSAMLVVLIPGPVIILEGKANLLQPRSNDRTAEGNFYLLAVLDCRAGTFQLNIDIRYSLEDIVSIGGSIEAFFDFNNDQNWYIYIGRKEPENKRIFADILSLFRASVYFMIDPRSLQFGASVGLNIDETWGPVALRLIIRLSVDTAIFFKPFQLEGRLELLIDLAVSIFGIGIRIMLQAILEGKSPNPFWIHGVARATVGLFFPLPSFDVSVEFTWAAGVPTEPEWPLLKQDENNERKVYMLHHKSTEFKQVLFYSPDIALMDYSVVPVVPVDARPSITFAKNIHNLKKSDDSPLLDILRDKIGDSVFEYKLNNLHLDKSTSRGWVPVRSGVNKSKYPGVTPFYITNDIDYSSFTNGVNAEEPILELWRTCAMDNRNSYERETYTNSHPPCPSVPSSSTNIVNWFEEPVGLTYALLFTYKNILFIADFVPDVNNNNPIISRLPIVGNFSSLIKNSSAKALRITNFSVRFPQRIVKAELRIAIGIGDGSPSVNSLQAKLYRGGILLSTSYFMLRAERGVNLFFLRYENLTGFDTIKVEETGTADKAVWLYSIEYTTYEEYTAVNASTGDSSPAIANSNIGSDLILEPDTLYRLMVSTEVTSNAAIDYFYFKTDKGPGILPDAAATQSIVRQLPTYISDSYPSNGATNHYFGYDIGVGFNETYVKKLYKNELTLRIKDRNGKYIGNDGNTFLPGGWMTGFTPLINNGLLSWLFAKQKGGCLNPEPPITFQPVLNFPAPKDLKPNSLYIAELMGSDAGKDYILHTFQFTTSRYKNFTSHFTGLPDLIKETSVATIHKLPALNRALIPATVVAPATLTTTALISEKRNQFERQREGLHAATGYIAHARTLNKTQAVHQELAVINTVCFDQLYPSMRPSFEAIGMVIRPVPPGVEFLQIPVSGTDLNILLIESPEPIVWNRISGSLTINNTNREIGFIWNADQTKAFLRAGNSIGFKAGEYTLQLVFNARPDFTSGLYRYSPGSESFLDERITVRLTLK